MIAPITTSVLGASLIIALSASAQVRPLPNKRPVALDMPELEIVEVRRFGDVTDAIRLNEMVPVEVVVRNTGRRSAVVRAGTPNDRAGRGQPLIRYGPVRTIGPGATVNLPLQLEATGNRFRGDRFETTVFLFHPASPSDPPLGRLFTDGNKANNEFRTSFAFERPRTYDVVATLYRLLVYDDCDNASSGDWNVHFAMAELRGDVVAQKTETYWPGRDEARDVDSRTTVAIDKDLRLSGVSPASRLLLTVTATDCDADSPFSWPVTVAAANLTEKPMPVSTGPVAAYFQAAGGCSGEEIWEISGHHDRAGSYSFLLEPAAWQAASTADRRHTGYEHHNCNESASPAYRPSVRLETTVR